MNKSELDIKLNPKALKKDELGRLQGTKQTIPMYGNSARIRLEPDEIIIKLSIDKDVVKFTTCSGSEVPDNLKGLVKTILVVCSKAEGVKELMGLARKLTR